MMKKVRALVEAGLLIGVGWLIYEILFFVYNYLIYQGVKQQWSFINIDAYLDLSGYEEAALAYVADHPLEYTLLCWLVIFVLFLLIMYPTGQRFTDLFSFRWLSIGNGLASIFAGFGLVFLINGAVRFASDVAEIDFEYLSDDIFSVYNIWYLMVIVGLVTPFFEELFFRGILLGRLKNGFGPLMTVLLSAVLFSLSHLNVIQGIYVLPVGILAAYLVLETGSVFSAVWLHMVYNLVNIYLAKIDFFQYNSVQLLVIALLGMVLLALGLNQIRPQHRAMDS